ncbi:CRISPR-associated protein Cas4 [Halorientalis halophila]|uniref:CRISPR-associated protein Cas4 n=1 Tax=Halorientalis halophila TaxID=3108499 RepID=UPI00300B465D
MHTFRDVETAAYCPRKLYYRRRSGPPDVPDEVAACRQLAFEYERLLDSDADLLAAPIEVSPTRFRSQLGRAKARLDAWDALVDPPHREQMLDGRECRGVAHKVLEEPLAPSLVFAGAPPDEGVWKPQTARLVAAAKALSWERETPVERAFAEYPAYGVVREVLLTTRRKAAYRSAVRTADAVDGPPARIENDAKCGPCEFRNQCGVRTRSLRSLL